MLGGKSRSKILSIHPSGGVTGAGKEGHDAHQRGLQHVEIVLPHQPIDVDGVQEPPVQPRAPRLEAERRALLAGGHLLVRDAHLAGRVRRRHRRAAVCTRRRAPARRRGRHARAGCAGADLVRSFNSGRCPVEWHRRVATPTAKTDFSTQIKKSWSFSANLIFDDITRAFTFTFTSHTQTHSRINNITPLTPP